MGKRGGLLLVTLVVGLVIAIGVYLAYSVRTRGAAADDPAAADATAVPIAPGASQSLISIDNRTVMLNIDPSQLARLQSEGGVAPLPTALPTATTAPTVAPLGATATPTNAPVPATAVPQTGGNMLTTGCTGPLTWVAHTVQPGETLYSLTTIYATSVSLMAECGISAIDLVPGTPMQLPVVAANACPGRRAHLVLESDNVFRIADKYGTTKEQIQTINGLNANFMIQIGQVLCVP